MSFFHKKNVANFMGHHYAIWASDSNILLTQEKFRHCIIGDYPMNLPTKFGSNWPSGFKED